MFALLYEYFVYLSLDYEGARCCGIACFYGGVLEFG
jgi:hypothetical protein